MKDNFLLIGVDGGATKVSAWEVNIESDEENLFGLGALNEQRSYRDIPGYIKDFKPVDLSTQLQEWQGDTIKPEDDEIQQAAVYIEAAAQVIETLARRSKKERILVGLGMPGLKTGDKRGIAVVANGPRMITYARQLEERLAMRNIRFVRPIHQLGSDADYCGIGENYAAEGLFRDVDNAYYLGGGTGVADALKLNGKLLPFDRTKSWLAKSWEMKSAEDLSLEKYASAGGIQSLYAEQSGLSVEELNARGVYPPQIAQKAADGEQAAGETYRRVAEQMALLLYERISTLYAGWQGLFQFVNPQRPSLEGEHPYQGTLLQRIILGQRLGELFELPVSENVLKNPMLRELQQHIDTSSALDETAKKHYANISDLIVVSRLREAPAVGAGVDAYLNYKMS